MKYLLTALFILGILAPTALAVTGEDVRWDWELGEPTVTLDATAVCTDTAVARADWVLGEPTVVFDATANCTAAVAADVAEDDGIIWFTNF